MAFAVVLPFCVPSRSASRIVLFEQPINLGRDDFESLQPGVTANQVHRVRKLHFWPFVSPSYGRVEIPTDPPRIWSEHICHRIRGRRVINQSHTVSENVIQRFDKRLPPCALLSFCRRINLIRQTEYRQRMSRLAGSVCAELLSSRDGGLIISGYDLHPHEIVEIHLVIGILILTSELSRQR